MGGHCDGSGSRYSAWELPSKRTRKREFKPSCGYIAIANMLEIDVKTLTKRFQEKIEDALSCQDIMRIVKDLSPKLSPDCRYCSMKRTTLDLPPLLKGMTGIVALKEKKGNATHWLYVDEKGVIVDANGRDFFFKGMSTYAPYADGYGHKVVFWEPQASQFLDNVYMTPQAKKDCSKCMAQRSPFDEVRRAISF